MKTKIAVVLIIMFIFSAEGCAMNSDKNSSNNNLENNGLIIEEKALTLAKDYILSEGLDKILDFKKIRPVCEKDDAYDLLNEDDFEADWIFIIPTTSKVRLLQGLKWGIIYVNRKSGKIIYGGEGPS